MRGFPLPQRQLARLVLEEMVSAGRTKRVVTADELALALNLAAPDLPQVLERLVRAHLIRPLEDLTPTGYELVHDYLAGQIVLSPEVQARKAVEELIAQELRNYRTLDGKLISADALRIILEWQDRLRLSQAARQLIQESREKQELDEQAQLHLIQADKAAFLRRLVASVDRAMSSPLASISSNADLIREGVAEVRAWPVMVAVPDLEWLLHDMAEIAGELHQAAAQMTPILKALSQLAQPDDAGEQGVDVHACLDAALLLLAAETMRQTIWVETAYMADTPLVPGVPGLLLQLCVNVLMVCIEAIPAGWNRGEGGGGNGRLHITTHYTAAEVHIHLRHNGRPLPEPATHSPLTPALMSNQPFHGGLSLPIIRHITQRHNGRFQMIPAANLPDYPPGDTILIIALPATIAHSEQ